ncbi:MAG: response regulator [Terriglobales bacterium]|jgi:DNA-binding response OmpR family regulator
MSRANRGPQRILLCIDDSHAISNHEKSLFENSGFIVVTALSVPQGLKLAMMFHFDAVLLDYQMSGVDGHQLALEMRHIRSDTPVIMFSHSDIPEETRRLVDAVVTETISREDAVSAVTRICDRASSS